MPRRSQLPTLGSFMSAALPALWKALARENLLPSNFGPQIVIKGVPMSDVNGWRIATGRRGVSNDSAIAFKHRFGIDPELWSKTCPPNWKPSFYPDLRRRARARLDMTGTD